MEKRKSCYCELTAIVERCPHSLTNNSNFSDGWRTAAAGRQQLLRRNQSELSRADARSNGSRRREPLLGRRL